MANKKIKLTFLWADESVMMEDFSKGTSAKMVDWGNEFFGRYGFELDIDPPPLLRKSMATTRKYALVKNNGVVPDLRDPDEILFEDRQKIEKLNQDFDAKTKAYLALGGGASNARINAASQAMDRAFKDLMAAYDQLGVKITHASGELDLRGQIGSKFVLEGIGSEVRHSVVFCKWNNVGLLTMRREIIVGLTYPKLSRPVISLPLNMLVWPYTFSIVDIKEGERRTPSHEFVHAAGHAHPKGDIIFSKIQKKILTIAARSLMGAPISDIKLETEEVVPYRTIGAAYFDGPDNDIMNYTLDDPDAGSCILQDADRELIDRYVDKHQ